MSVMPVSFGSTVMRFDFLVIGSVAYELMIGAQPLVEMYACINTYHQAVKMRRTEEQEY